MEKSVIASIPSFVVITTLVYALVVATTFFEMDNALGGENFVVDDKTYTQQEVETECKSPCPKSAEMCITMCA
jgi:hypothetical protein